MMRYGVNSNRPTALDMMPLELHPWYRHHLQRLGGGASQSAGVEAWRLALEIDPTDEFKEQGIELCEKLLGKPNCAPRTPWGKAAVGN